MHKQQVNKVHIRVVHRSGGSGLTLIRQRPNTFGLEISRIDSNQNASRNRPYTSQRVAVGLVVYPKLEQKNYMHSAQLHAKNEHMQAPIFSTTRV